VVRQLDPAEVREPGGRRRREEGDPQAVAHQAGGGRVVGDLERHLPVKASHRVRASRPTRARSADELGTR